MENLVSNNERINNLINLSIESQTQLMAEISDEIAFAGDRLTQCLLQDGKLLICGNGVSAAIADAFTSYLLNHFESERPPLPAICLCNTYAATAIGIDSGFHDVFAKQIRALGNENDLLITFCANGNAANTIKAIQAAHEKNMGVIALTAADGGDTRRVLSEEDIEICVPATLRAQVNLCHLTIVHCLLDLIDAQIFGLE